MANCIIVGNGGGSSGGSGTVNTVTQEEWSAMTYEDKQTAGLTVVTNGSETSGKWYDYSNVGVEVEYLPNSDFGNILTFANVDNFDETSLSWGTGSNPVTLQDYKAIDMETESVSIDVKTSEALGYVDLGSAGKSITVYAVMKIGEGHTSSYARHLSIMNAKSSGNGLLTYGNSTLKYSSWGSDTTTAVTGTEFYVVGFNYDGTNSHANINGNIYTKTLSTIGQYLCIGRSTYDGGNSGTNEEPADAFVKFLAVVDGAESEDVIAANVQNLMNKYNITA